jgi:hypothetical protein
MRDHPPKPMVRLTHGVLIAVSAFDAEELAAFPDGMLFDMIPRNKRSAPHNGKYWLILTKVCEATGLWPTREHLHKAIKYDLGYTEVIYGPNGKPLCVIPDSTAFDKMSQAEFNAFYERAMEWIARELAVDPDAV